MPPAPTFASGFLRIDAELPGGGWPRGALTELLAEHEGIGELGDTAKTVNYVQVFALRRYLPAKRNSRYAERAVFAVVQLDSPA
ncbi:MAG: hypothetical protein K9K30_09360 [Burkholderiaceae bacterium]|nr:hypothetical protein [Burkholderiaceae bacterium]